MIRPALLLGALLLSASACGQVSSDKVTTADLDATILLTGKDGGVQVSVTLLQNFHTQVDLGAGDDLVASSGDQSVTLSGSDGHYFGTLDVPPEAGTEVTVALEREKGDDAPSSAATLPEPVAILSPAAGSVLDPAKELTVTVDDQPGELHLTWTGSCVQTGDDIGRDVTISGDTIVVPPDAVERIEAEPQPCRVEFVVTRDLAGNVDSAFDKGSIAGRQQATLSLRLTRKPSA